MKKKIGVILGIVLSTTSMMGQYRYQETQARTIEPRTGMVTTPMVADVVILNNGEKYVSKPWDNGLIVNQNISSFINEYKNQALAAAMKENGADVMFGTLFEITTTSRNTTQIIVSGFPAKYTNIRMAKPEDSWMANLYNVVDRNQNATGVNNVKSQTIITP